MRRLDEIVLEMGKEFEEYMLKKYIGEEAKVEIKTQIDRPLEELIDEVMEKHLEIMDLWLDMLGESISNDHIEIVANNLEVLTKLKTRIKIEEYRGVYNNG